MLYSKTMNPTITLKDSKGGGIKPQSRMSTNWNCYLLTTKVIGNHTQHWFKTFFKLTQKSK